MCRLWVRMKAMSSLEQQAEVERVEVQVAVGADQLARVAAEGAGVDVLAADLQGVQAAEDAVGVLRDQAEQEVGDPLAGQGVELAEHPVVERGDHAAGEDPEVARVGIGVEEAEVEDLRQQDAGAPDRDHRRVDADPPQALAVVDADPADELHRQDPRGRELLHDEGDQGGRLAGELRLATLHGPALDVEVELALEAPLELAGQGDRPRTGPGTASRRSARLARFFRMSRSAWTTLSIPGLRIFSATVRPSGSDGAMDLRDRRGGDRHGVDRGEDLGGGRPYSSARIASASANGKGRTSSRSEASSVV